MSELIEWGGGQFRTNGSDIVPVVEHNADITREVWTDTEIRELAEELLDKGIIFDTEIEDFVAAAWAVGMFETEADSRFDHGLALQELVDSYIAPQDLIPGL